jgi:uncharacterized protein YjgD (DUF1641 family)
MTKYKKMTAKELQMEVMSQVTNMIHALGGTDTTAMAKAITGYSMALQQLTNLATKNDQ